MKTAVYEFGVTGQAAETIMDICNKDGRTLEEFFRNAFEKYIAIEQGKADGTIDHQLAEKNRHVQELVPS
ncbi:MAG TPA: hypothetical protein VLG13_03660 [Patescibacteria group bacterium]|nr:hypothetical protein [Patescibacteria group bacterium]